ncbi:MAG: hypothetical protein V3S55_00895, partial [Nitrospiraceae bacterium]
ADDVVAGCDGSMAAAELVGITGEAGPAFTADGAAEGGAESKDMEAGAGVVFGGGAGTETAAVGGETDAGLAGGGGAPAARGVADT